MSRATPWTIQSVHPELQDAARDAASREGVTLREWTQRAIDAHAAAKRLDPRDLNDQEREAAISERLTRESHAEKPRLFTVDDPSRGAAVAAGNGANKVDGMLKDLAARLKDSARASAPEPISHSAPWPTPAARRSGLQESLRDALRAASREPEPAQPPAPFIPHRQARGESPLRLQIDELARNVADLPRRQAQEREAQSQAALADERALRQLTVKTDEIRDLLFSVVARRTQTGRIERQLDLLSARIDALAASTPTMAECNELSRGLGEIRSLLSNGRNPDLLESLDRKIDELSRRMDTMAGKLDEPDKYEDLARRIDDVGLRIEANISNAPKVDTNVFERMIEELKVKLDQPAPRVEIPTLDFSPMEREIRRLSDKIDAVSARPEDPALDHLRRDITKLSARVEAISTTMQSSSLLSTQANSASLEALREDVNGLSSRIDRIAPAAPEGSMLDGLHSQMEILANRIEALPQRAPSGVHALEAQIVKLADKIDAISGSSHEKTMFAQLQAEIERLSRRLDATPADSTGPAAGEAKLPQALPFAPPRKARAHEDAIDDSIANMFQQIQALREAAMDEAEASERRAEQEVIAQKAPVVADANEALQRELSDLRAQQQIAEQRTTQTLNAVHETLERLVSRLSNLENEVGEVRPEPVEAGPAQAGSKQKPSPDARQEPRVEPRLDASGAAPRIDVKPTSNAAPVPPRMREPGPSAVLSNQASFIAAARRAAQAAAEEAAREPARPKAKARIEELFAQMSARAAEAHAEASAAPNAPEPQSGQPDPANKQGALAAIRRVISARRRPMLIALAGLVVILGSLETLRLTRNGEATTSSTQTTSPEPKQPHAALPHEPKAVAEAAPVTPAPDVTLAAPETFVAPGFSPPLAANGFDATPTSSTPPQPVDLADAAANGQANAQYEMGVRLAEGRGVTQDANAALLWLDKAAKQNFAPAQYRLAAMLERGLGGSKDLKRAQDLYSKAATQGHVRAMHNMGVLSAEGVDGRPDYAAAANWFRKAAEFGLRDSQYNLAILFTRGMGVEKNLPASYAWFNAAGTQGDADSEQKRDEIATRLTSSQLATAKAMVEAYRPHTPDPAINEVAQPAGGWDTMTISSAATPKPSPRAPAPKAKISKL